MSWIRFYLILIFKTHFQDLLEILIELFILGAQDWEVQIANIYIPGIMV